MSKSPDFHLALAASMQSLSLYTKFHQIVRLPPNGAPPSYMNRVLAVAVISGVASFPKTIILKLSQAAPSTDSSPSTT